MALRWPEKAQYSDIYFFFFIDFSSIGNMSHPLRHFFLIRDSLDWVRSSFKLINDSVPSHSINDCLRLNC